MKQVFSLKSFFCIFHIFTFRQYKLPMSHIIPFPKRTDPSSIQDFPPGRHVLAVYPGTTALYKATVVQSHKVKMHAFLVL